MTTLPLCVKFNVCAATLKVEPLYVKPVSPLIADPLVQVTIRLSAPFVIGNPPSKLVAVTIPDTIAPVLVKLIVPRPTRFLNVFVRNADIVKIANMAQLVNVIAPMFTSETDMFLQTIYYPLQLFATFNHGTSLDVFVETDTYNTDTFFLGLGESQTQQNDVPYLDVSATYKNNGEVVINVVNRHLDKPITAEIISQTGMFNGTFEVYEVNGESIKSQNDFGKTEVETQRKKDLKLKGDSFEYAFPAHSFTLIKGKIK